MGFPFFYIINNPIMHNNNVAILNTDTTLFSLHPDNSKWWCNGAILNILFPVFLKYATCNITDKVSNTGTNAIINNNSGILKYKAIHAIIPPKRREPVSPIITFAGCRLNIKNAKFAPHTIVPNITNSYIPNLAAITVKQVIIIVVTLVDNPVYSIC